MPTNLLQKGLSLLLKRQTNILSAAFIIMATVVFQQILGLVRQRLLVGEFGASNTLGVYLASSRLPDFIFQLIIAGALSSAFIPVFSDFLSKGKESEGHRMASTLLVFAMSAFLILSIPLILFAPNVLQLINPGAGYSAQDIVLMSNLMRIIIFGQILFIIGTFFQALLQSYNHFFIPGLAAALYNLGIIIGILLFTPSVGIYAPAYGVILGALFFIAAQLPMIRKVGFSFLPTFSVHVPGVIQIFKLMWPRSLSIGIFQVGSLVMLGLVSYLPSPGRNYVILDYAQTLAYAPIVLFGQTIAQAAFPVLSREKDRMDRFRETFITSFNHMLYLVVPFSVLFLVLRIPLVRIAFGADGFDWDATVLTGRTLAFFAISIFAQALIYLVSRGFYALMDTKTPLIVGAISTTFMAILGALFILQLKLGIESLAIAYTIASIFNVVVLMIFLDRKTGGFDKPQLFLSMAKIFLASTFTGFALYIPIKLLDQLVFDTTKTINLLLLTGISSLAGLALYLFLTWLFNVKEAATFLLMFKKVGNWKEILQGSKEVIDPTISNP